MARQTEELQLWQTAAPVEFLPPLSDKQQAQSLLITARQGTGFEVAAGQLGHAIAARANRILMDFSATGCNLRYQVDGNWEQVTALDRETADPMLYALKQLSLMNPSDRRSGQSGQCGLKIKKDKYQLKLQSQGVKSGERVLARIDPETVPFARLTDLGMRDKMIEAYKGQLNDEGNIVVITAPKGEGLTTTWDVSLNAADRFVRDFQSFEPEKNPEPEVINVGQNYFGGDTGRTELELLKKMVLREPDTLVFPNLPTKESMEVVVKQIETANKQLITRMVAGSAMEAAVKLVAHYPESASSIAGRLGGVLNQRLARRLCENCKVGFEPSAQLLQQLGIPRGRVGVLYQPFIPPPPEQQVDENGKPAPITPCHVCGGRGYFGRLAIFELLVPGEKLKAALPKTRDVAKLMGVAKSEGHRNIKAEAVLTVARGLTSLDELKRVFAKK